jgi:phosphogluconate dehydratase
MVDPRIAAVTERVVARSRPTRRAYLDLIARERDGGAQRPRLSCGNLAHGFAAALEDKPAIIAGRAPNIGIVTAYNDMLSAHQPYGRYPEQMKLWAREVGATAQVAGGVPAMCDGVTQGQPGMELSLFSRDVIAMSTAVALSHGMFEGAALLGICDKIVPGLLIGALRFGHLPMLLVPGGPMPSGLPNKEKARIRQLYAEGKASEADLLECEAASYHSPGTCTFYGTANSNQMMMEVMGLHVPGAAFVPPNTRLRQALTRAAVHRVAEIGWAGNDYRPLGALVDERAIVNAAVGLLATGGSTNHAIHLPAIARAAGVLFDWADLDALSSAVPLIARVYPNGSGDVNDFQAAGGMAPCGGRAARRGAAPRPPDRLARRTARLCRGASATRRWRPNAWLYPPPRRRGSSSDKRSCAGEPHRGERPAPGPPPSRGWGENGGGDPVAPRHRNPRPHHAPPPGQPLPARRRHAAGTGQSRPRDVQDERGRARTLDDRGARARVRDAGGRARRVQDRQARPRRRGRGQVPGTARERDARAAQADPALGIAPGPRLPCRARDGRMSGASGKVPAAIHCWPEALAGGPLARLRDGDLVRLSAEVGTLDALVPAAEWEARTPAAPPLPALGTGRELFAFMRAGASTAEEGGSAMLAAMLGIAGCGVQTDADPETVEDREVDA